MNISALPVPDAAALNHQERVLAHLHSQIDASGGWISFARYMELVLYAPGLLVFMYARRTHQVNTLLRFNEKLLIVCLLVAAIPAMWMLVG